ncbi:esterase-like activity of phytase family protein [Caulobacter soli]|uniref:esterase-like activity of phytase family protein n=1 Tax=Caulobacter soli TaxID=2708539 RepID=UPI0013ED23F1|nr:esterase-like activity of phytase family protein [Caulobacter soli]
MPRRLAILLATALVSLTAGAAHAQSQTYKSQTYTTKHWTNAAGDETATLDGQVFVNHGLVGVGRLPAATRDFRDETLGSFSSMALDAKSWRRLKDGSYTGVFWTLPDRGPNNIGGLDTTDYANRIHTHRFTFKPADSKGGGKLTVTPTGGFLLLDQTGKPFTGKDPGPGTLTRDGITYPSPASGEGAGRISLDSEGLARLPDGGFYVSDEYAAGVYLFDRTGRQVGAIAAPPALAPMADGKLNFSAAKPPATGRRNNQGLEAAAVTPDGTRLITILQSATVQDTAGADAATRNNTRILVYDITKTRTPKAPIGHYVLQLPTVRQKADGQPADVTAAQSEMVALNDHQFLVLSRDGNGRGTGKPYDGVFKSILLVDTRGATNLAGTPYEQTAKPVAKAGALVDGIAPVKQVELVNFLNPVQLARFGMNLSTTPSTPYTLSEKLEALALAPALDPKAPNDVFLFVGNDNDFETAKGRVNGQDFDASLTNADGSGVGDNDNVILVYRLTLPTRPR